MRLSLALALLATALLGCPPARARATQWPQADALFHQDPRWLGADAAFSVPLGDGRVLWLFGDTFVAKTAANVRSESTMARNTVGIQRGADPTTATMRFAWRGTPAAPSSFFAEEGDRWYWPGHGLRLGDGLVLFLQRLRATPGEGLGFEVEGWRAAIVDDATGEPSQWALRLVAPTTAPAGLAVGGALALDGDRVIALAVREPGDHAGFLARWTAADLAAGNLDTAEWWTADRGWVAQAALGGLPSVIMPNAGPESSLHFDAAKGHWVHVRSEGFGASTIVVSTAPAPQGPWSAPQAVFRPPESDRAHTLVYAAKGHPEQSAGGALAVTYATNDIDSFAALVNDTTLYYPRFVKVQP